MLKRVRDVAPFVLLRWQPPARFLCIALPAGGNDESDAINLRKLVNQKAPRTLLGLSLLAGCSFPFSIFCEQRENALSGGDQHPFGKRFPLKNMVKIRFEPKGFVNGAQDAGFVFGLVEDSFEFLDQLFVLALEHILEVSCCSDPVSAEFFASSLNFVGLFLSQVKVKQRLVNPIDKSLHWNSGVQHNVNQVCRGQILHILDPFFQ